MNVVRHLPPSSATLNLLDVNGEAGDLLHELRGDVAATPVSGAATDWHDVTPDSADAVVALEYVMNDDFLAAAMDALRPGGRLIVANTRGDVDAAHGRYLENAGYVRILVEAAAATPEPFGVLMRGEKPHTTDDTLARVGQVATQDADLLDLETFRGRYVHLLVTQTPNKPVWYLQADESVRWDAVGLELDGRRYLLAFSSLPKAVNFMQPAVLEGLVQDVNKVGKFSKATAYTWTQPVLLNPPTDVLRRGIVLRIAIDPNTAETPDE